MNTPTANPTPASNPSPGCLLGLAAAIGVLWVIPFACLRLVFPLGASAGSDDAATQGALYSAIALLILVGLPVQLLAAFIRTQPFRGIFRSWLAALVITALLLPVYFVPAVATQTQTLIQSGLLLACVLVLLLFLGRRALAKPVVAANPATWDTPSVVTPRPATLPALLLAALTAGMFVAYPWFARGALGSLTDTLLALLLAGLVGFAAGMILEIYTFYPLRSSDLTLWVKYLAGGLASSGVLALLGSALAYPFGGVQLFVLLSLVLLGWVVCALHLLVPNPERAAGSLLRRSLPTMLLVMLAAGAVLAFVDPEETTLILSGLSSHEVLPVAFQASFLSLIIGGVAAMIAAVAYALSLRRPEDRAPAGWAVPVWLALFLVATIGAAGVYAAAGRPGFYGDRIFVILKDQADLSAPAGISDPIERRQAVFDELTRFAAESQAPIRAGLDRLGADYTPYYLVNALEVDDSPVTRAWLNTQPAVDRILSSPVLRPLPEPPPPEPGMASSPPSEPDWNLTMIHADRVWDELDVTGEGILVGQSDSGVQGDHPELEDSYRGADGQKDSWFDPWYATQTPIDRGGHGTHTLGSVLGDYVGVAPDAEWIACVNLARNLGNPALYLDCWQFNLAPFPLGGNAWADGNPRRGANVLNNSWGCPKLEGCDAGTFQQAVRALRAAGVFVVASAGNDGPTCGSLSVPPPTYPEVLSVGAVDTLGDLAGFSSIGLESANGEAGTRPDLVAPGVNVVSSLPGSSYGANSGTSMAGPHVVGVVALMWSANPNLIGDIDRTEQILAETAAPYTGTVPDCPGASATPSTAYGYGIVDAYAAVQAAIAGGK